MECLSCTQTIKYPVAVAPAGSPHHLMALCSYLAHQLLTQSGEANPALLDMSRRDVQQVVQLRVPERVVNFFPRTFEELNENEQCNEWRRGISVQQEELAIRIAREFISSRTNPDGFHSISKGRMIEIRNAVLRAESADDECWLKSLKSYFDGMGVGSWAVMTGCIAIGVIVTKEVGRSFGLVSTKKDDQKTSPTLVVDPEKLQALVSTKV